METGFSHPYTSVVNDVRGMTHLSLHCALSLAAQCIVIAPVYVFVCEFVCLWVCYHDKSKSRASILTKLGLY